MSLRTAAIQRCKSARFSARPITLRCDHRNIRRGSNAHNRGVTNYSRWIDQGLNKPGKSGSELGRLLNLTRDKISKMRSGARQPRAEEIPLIEQYLGEPAPHRKRLGDAPSSSRSKSRAMRALENLDTPNAAGGFSEEVVALKADEDFGGLKAGANQGVWRVWSRALELAGYLPGDAVLVDATVAPVSGDVVCVQIFDDKSGGYRTRLRLYQPPHVVTSTMDRKVQAEPLAVDNDRVWIWGTVIRSVRQRRG